MPSLDARGERGGGAEAGAIKAAAVVEQQGIGQVVQAQPRVDAAIFGAATTTQRPL